MSPGARSMRRWFTRALVLLLLCAAAIAAAAWWWTHRPLPLAGSSVEVSIEPGSSPRGVAQAWVDAGVQTAPWLLYEWFRWSGQARLIRAGSYEIGAGTTPISLLPHFRSGKLRALAVTGAARMPDLPDVPIAADTVPGYVVTSWYAVLAPGGTPRAVIDSLNAALNKSIQAADLKRDFQKNGIDVTGGAPERLADIVRRDQDRWSMVVKNAGIVLD